MEDAASLDPVILRSLDSIHLASARYLGTSLDSMIFYDHTLAEAAKELGFSVLAPE